MAKNKIKQPDQDDLKYYKVLLREWVNTADSESAQKIGPEFEKIYQQLPKAVKVSPSLSLYRIVLVEEEAFEKITSGKPLILKNRKYSSWTYSLNAAYKFATHRSQKSGQVSVILNRRFKSSEILINIIALAAYVGIDWEDSEGQMIMREQEIIVKNSHKIFEFKPEEIYEYKLFENREWHRNYDH